VVPEPSDPFAGSGAGAARALPPSRVALVTGAGRGIGRQLATGLARAGLAVGLLGRSRELLDEVAAEVAAGGGRAAVAVADVRDLAAVRAAVEALEAELGGADLLVNNAGRIESVEVPIWEADPQEWWEVAETDLRGPFHCIRAVVPGMIARGGGRVVDLSSGAGAVDRPVYSAYCAAKAGLIRIGGHLHLAGYERGLRSFELSPGVIRTGMTESMGIHQGRTEWTDPQRVIELVVELAAGSLDAWSGCFLRADVDTPQGLRAAAAGLPEGTAVEPPLRRMVVLPWGPGDPLSPMRRV
jgi:NAD(P)-dependent dehydrogenase (short-subunit alcohol dehydrogenase family)